MKCTKTCWSRREFLFQSGGGVSGLALAYLMNRDGLLAADTVADACQATPIGLNPYAPKPPHFKPRAKAVISLFMSGGVSHVDTFDPKPALTKYAGQPLDGMVKGDVIVRQGYPGPLMPSPFTFKRYGQSGIEISELFPNLAACADEIAFIRSAFGQSNDHVQATYEMQTGQIRMGFPSMGSWITYGLGSENASLPAYVVIHDARGGPLGGVNDWTSGFLPAAYQGTLFRATGDPIVDLKPPSGVTPEQQRARLDLLAKLNELDMQQYPGNSDLAARIASYELAYRMQGCAPDALDISRESEATRKLYGLDDKVTEPFGRQCLIARRLVEHGVRFVQLFHGGLGNQNVDTWDAHGDVKSNHTQHAAESDRPIAGLLSDLKARGLLDTTLVHWGGEMGRLPVIQNDGGAGKVGRDHNTYGFTSWLAGGGLKAGAVYGATDEFGHHAVENVVTHPAFREGRATTSLLDTTPELLSFKPRRDRATKLLKFLGHVTVNGNPHAKGYRPPAPLASADPPVHEPHAPVPPGTRQKLLELGPKLDCIDHELLVVGARGRLGQLPGVDVESDIANTLGAKVERYRRMPPGPDVEDLHTGSHQLAHPTIEPVAPQLGRRGDVALGQPARQCRAHNPPDRDRP